MTIQEALARVSELKPNQYSEEQLVRWLSVLDMIAYEEVISWHCGYAENRPGQYDPDEDLERELLIPDPYSEVYIHWLIAQIDYHNGDMQRYQNSMIAYNTAYSSFADWYNRKYPSKPVRLTVYGG